MKLVNPLEAVCVAVRLRMLPEKLESLLIDVTSYLPMLYHNCDGSWFAHTMDYY